METTDPATPQDRQGRTKRAKRATRVLTMTIVLILPWLSAIIVAIALTIVTGINAMAPNPAVHASVTEACNGPVEMAAVFAANPAALAQIKNAQQSSGSITTADGPIPIVSRVASGDYVVTVGSGSNAKTCYVPLASTHL
jgi:hypothetical protein